MRRKRKKTISKLGFIFIFLILSLAGISVSYSGWYDIVTIDGRVQMACWTPCISINKTLDDIGCIGELRLTITVSNSGLSNLSNVVVTDSIGLETTPIPGTISPSKGSVSWVNTTVNGGTYHNLTWSVGTLEPNETASLSMCITVQLCEGDDQDCLDTHCVDAQVLSPPESPPRYHVTRIIHDPPGWTEDVYYWVEYTLDGRGIKFEDARDAPTDGEENLLGENGDEWHHETDTFVITVVNGSNVVTVYLKAGGGGGSQGVSGTLDGEGDSIVLKGFNVTLEIIKIIDLGGNVREYTIKVTSESNSRALSHIEFDFGRTCRVIINEGATVTAEAEYSPFCEEPLQVTTERLILLVDEEGNVISSLPISTPTEEVCCDD